MDVYDLSHLTGPALDDALPASAASDSSSTASFLAHLAEYDARKRYRSAGYPSMFAYCIERLHLAEDSAARRIQGARIARQYPLLFAAVADGRLNLTAVRLLGSHLTPENCEELISAATHRSCAEIEQMLARRFVRLETLMEGSRSSAEPSKSVPSAPAPEAPVEPALMIPLPAPERVETPAPPSHAEALPVRPEPSVWVALEASANERLEYARALLSHRMPLESASKVVEYALNLVIAEEERKRFAATERPRPARGQSSRPRHVPAQVKRAVWKRDGGRCTFVGTDGHRCGSRKFLEFDHIDPVALGGRATVEGIRLRCRAHNQYEAERMFGAEFMQRKREEAHRERGAHVRQAHGAKPG